ncbi:MAG: cytochrome c biogenesis CcdA family protein [Micrococcales bacterium]
MNPTEIVLNSSLLVAIPFAILAGLVSFISPCVLPLVPGYLGFVSGMASSEKGKGKIVLGTVLFVLGFTLVFVLLGTALGSLGTILLVEGRIWVQPIAGALVILLGLVLMGQFGFMQKTIKLNITPKAGLAFAPLLGIIFGLGWTPCIGPTLSAVMTLVLTEGSAGKGALLAFCYSLGIGLPFIALAFGFSWATGSVAFVRKHIRGFNIAGGALLILLGLLLVTGLWNTLIAQVQGVFGVFVPIL